MLFRLKPAYFGLPTCAREQMSRRKTTAPLGHAYFCCRPVPVFRRLYPIRRQFYPMTVCYKTACLTSTIDHIQGNSLHDLRDPRTENVRFDYDSFDMGSMRMN